jgi:hypothetical protein
MYNASSSNIKKMKKICVGILFVFICALVTTYGYMGSKTIWGYAELWGLLRIILIALIVIFVAALWYGGWVMWYGLDYPVSKRDKSIAWLIFGILLFTGLLYMAITITKQLDGYGYNANRHGSMIIHATKVIGACFGYLAAFITLLYITMRPLTSLLNGNKTTENSEND